MVIARSRQTSAVLGGTRCTALAPVGNKALVVHALEALRNAGADRITLVGTDMDRGGFASTVGDGTALGVPVTYADPTSATAAQSLASMCDLRDGAPIVVMDADALLVNGLSDAIDALQSRSLDGLFLATSAPRPREAEDDDRHSARVYDLAPPGAPVAAVLSWSAATDLPLDGNGGWLIELLRLLSEGGAAVDVRRTEAAWRWSGESESLLEANRLVLEEIEPTVEGATVHNAKLQGRVALAPGAVVENATIRGPVVIGRGASVRDAYVGPYTAIGDEVEIDGAEIEHSIVLPRAALRHVGSRIESSLVGAGATVCRTFEPPGALRLHIGANALVTLG